jgi:hypothetical protein
MKRRYLLVFLLVFTYGCVGPTIVPSKDLLARVTQVQVVAMEAPPLDLPSRYQSLVGGPSGIGPLIPIQAAGGSITAVRGLGVFNTLLIFVQLTESSYRSYDASKSSQTVLDTKGVWTPTVVLANEISKQLMASGIAAHVTPGVKPIPGVEFRGATTTMENWLAPIRAHYNYTGPVQSYRALASNKSLFVLEVSISNYEVVNGKLLLQMHLKLIDPSGDRIVGRARSSNAWNMPSLEPLDQSLANDASQFKEVFSETGRQLSKESLAELGLLPPAD